MQEQRSSGTVRNGETGPLSEQKGGGRRGCDDCSRGRRPKLTM
jgi:hypothetical protein